MLVGFLLVLAGGCPMQVWSQSTYFDDYPSWESAVASGKAAVAAVGDVDGDGDLDLICGNAGAPTTLYRNRGGVLETTPSWSTAESRITRGVALGDINGDGYLDLVCANYGQSATLYLNHAGVFERTPSWSSSLTSLARCLALGDVDGDGDLDLVIGNDGASHLYLNRGGVFEATPSWSSGSSFVTRSVALGDVDDDGALDLVCGNFNQQTVLYLNRRRTFQTTPSWYSARPDATRGIALGDLDCDGDLDLACGNDGQKVTFYRNLGGTFETTPVWSSYYEHPTSCVALGDVDGDGDLDLACGSELYGTLLYVNEGCGFGGILFFSWSPAHGIQTSGIDLGDIDGDGDLDLMCGEDYGYAVMYLNKGNMFVETPSWTSARDTATVDAALGDIDGDGYLDLVRGNYEQSQTLYINRMGTFEDVPSWSSDLASATRGVALGDVDRDGDLDLACGNDERSTFLYLNQGGTFGDRPSWSTALAYHTFDVAFGDVDGNGYPDLVCGNWPQSPPDPHTSLFLNQGGTLATTASWTTLTCMTRVVALEDINGDGDLDLVVGEEGCSVSVHLNAGSGFGTAPAWSSTHSEHTDDMALGDVDGDGDSDLVCGRVSLYLNQGGMFEDLPSWSTVEPIGSYSDVPVALGDIDGDGDLDLVCGNGDEHTVMFYFNQGGTFETLPSWSMTAYAQRIKLGDIDRDGDLDFVSVHSMAGYPNHAALYLSRQAPAYKKDPRTPTNQLPNNGAYVRFAQAGQTAPDTYKIVFTAVDVESDPLWLMVEYQSEGVPNWHPADVAGYSGRIGPFATSPLGVTDSLEWDTHRLPFDTRDFILRLRVIENPRRVSLIQHAAPYILEVGPIEAHRPEISSSVEEARFSTVTVGDTAAVDVVIENTGNLLLIVNAIEFPSTEMRHDVSLPLDLAPGVKDTLRFFLEPRLQDTVSGNLRIMSNDPLTPELPIAVTTDIRPLRFKTRLLNPAQKVPLGEALTFNIIPDPDVAIESGYIHYRPADSGTAGFDSVGIGWLAEGDFVGTIPGDGVTEAGLEYFTKVENSGVFGTDPPGAPAVFYTQAVEPPALIAAEPIPTSGQDYLEAREIRVQILLPTGSSLKNGALHYRESGTADYQIDSLAAAEAFPTAVIPDSMVTARGIEYWVDVNTLTAHLTDPPVDPSLDPRTLRVTVQDLIEPHAHGGGEKAESYRIMSIPLEFKDDFGGTIEALLSDQPAFGPYDPVNWRSWVYLAESGTYGELSDQSLAERFRPEPGRAFWLISRKDHQISTAPVSGLSVATDVPFALELASGWNMVGSPFAFPVSWDSVRVDTLAMSEALGVSVDPPIRWDGGYVLDVPAMEPFEGYWLYNRTDHAITLHIPPKEAVVEELAVPTAVAAAGAGAIPPAAAGASASPRALAAHGSGLRLLLRAASGDHQDAFALIGMAPEAARALDRFDRMKPPSAPGEGISLYFLARGEGERCHRLSADMRPEPTGSGDWGEVWACDIEKSFSREPAGDAVTIFIDSIAGLLPDAKAVLVDRTLDREISLDGRGEYTFYLGIRTYVSTEEEARFRLIVGTESFVQEEASHLLDLPTRAALYQNYPNPSNPSTIIRYDIAEPGTVSLRIYSVTGALVRVLEARHRNRGRYEIGWNGENDRGERVASGVYFYRLTAPGYSQTRKIVLVK